VCRGLQSLKNAHFTSIRVQLHASSLQEIPRRNSVSEQKPTKDFVFHLALGVPNPLEGRMNLSMTDNGFIGFRSRKNRISPDVRPSVRAIRLVEAINFLLKG
jgi:hypothetical protein